MPKAHANYGKDFRQEALNLLLGSGRPLKRLAAPLILDGRVSVENHKGQSDIRR